MKAHCQKLNTIYVVYDLVETIRNPKQYPVANLDSKSKDEGNQWLECGRGIKGKWDPNINHSVEVPDLLVHILCIRVHTLLTNNKQR